MAFPHRVRTALAEIDCTGLSGTLATDTVCEGAKFHSPTPLVLHEVALGSGEEVVTLCGGCRDNMGILLHLMEQTGYLPWPVLREFGNLIRAIAIRAWQVDHPDAAVAENEDASA